MNLQEIKEKHSKLAGDWNGEDKKFVSGGISYTDDTALLSRDIVDLIEGIEKEEFLIKWMQKEIKKDIEIELADLLEKHDF